MIILVWIVVFDEDNKNGTNDNSDDCQKRFKDKEWIVVASRGRQMRNKKVWEEIAKQLRQMDRQSGVEESRV